MSHTPGRGTDHLLTDGSVLAWFSGRKHIPKITCALVISFVVAAFPMRVLGFPASLGQDGYGRQIGDFYGVLFIVACLVSAMVIGGNGLYLFIDKRRRWLGGILIAIALTLAIAGCGTGASGFYPWHW
jgi:apolipoprotein N-acyltransferase